MYIVYRIYEYTWVYYTWIKEFFTDLFCRIFILLGLIWNSIFETVWLLSIISLSETHEFESELLVKSLILEAL